MEGLKRRIEVLSEFSSFVRRWSGGFPFTTYVDEQQNLKQKPRILDTPLGLIVSWSYFHQFKYIVPIACHPCSRILPVVQLSHYLIRPDLLSHGHDQSQQ